MKSFCHRVWGLSLMIGWVIGVIGIHNVSAQTPPPSNTSEAPELRVMSWNIWHGGREDGEQVGPQRVVEVIQESGADIVAMQETYGSGELISQSLGFHFQPRGTNLSIHSRYPIVEDISVFEKFKCVGSLIQLPNQQQVAVYAIWLPYGKDIWLADSRDGLSRDELVAACQPSESDLKKINNAINDRLSDKKYEGVPVMIAGDFNSMSHLDYSEVAQDQFQQVVDWPTSHVLIDAGFRDSYRETNPSVDRKSDSTWSPRFPEQSQDRIDFIYYRSDRWRAVESKVIREHPIKFPSDHAALITRFRYQTKPSDSRPNLRVVSYNIRRGLGTDNRTDLTRSAAVLEKLQPDFVGLQEVDLNVTRSGKINQAWELGKRLNMHAAFGPFIDLQGGKYGMAVLSKFPIKQVTQVKLPDGNEPRVALAVEVVLPNDQSMVLVNVHFDWVNDDKFRFAQAEALKKYLDQLTLPYLLLGDFNDQPDSRTLKLLRGGMVEADKPEDDRLTFSATEPVKEIDFIFAAPPSLWRVIQTAVLDEPIASDHRPVVAEWIFK